MPKTTFSFFIVIAVLAGVVLILIGNREPSSPSVNEDNIDPEPVACTMEAKMCPDGSFVGRTGPNCEFEACPIIKSVPADVQKAIDEKADLIQVTSPVAGVEVKNPISVSGKARGPWYFEGSFPLVVTDWDGIIIGQGFATAEGDWMTEDFVPFSGTVNFEGGTGSSNNKGWLIFKKDNQSL